MLLLLLSRWAALAVLVVGDGGQVDKDQDIDALTQAKVTKKHGAGKVHIGSVPGTGSN